MTEPASSTPTAQASARAQWDQAAAGWDAHEPQIRRWLARATEGMLDLAGIGPGSHVLDVAAGAGGQTLDIAERVGPSGQVLATDLSPAILARAQANAARAGHANVQTKVADGQDLGVEPASFDTVVCRLGLMLFPDPLRALREMHRALRPGGAACTVVFSQADRNPCITMLLSTALKHAGLPPRDPYAPGSLLSLGQPGRIDALFADAGFEAVATTRIDAPFQMPSVKAYIEFLRSSASPINQILGRLDEAAAGAAWAEMEDKLSAFSTPTGWSGPNELLLTAGRRAGP
jgi:SAM-dependent methyltransferase